MENEDRGHVALPKLFGAPAYARPTVVPVRLAERPFSPDDLPLECELSSEELELVQELARRPDGVRPAGLGPRGTAPREEEIPYSRSAPPMLGVLPARIRGIGSLFRRDGTGG